MRVSQTRADAKLPVGVVYPPYCQTAKHQTAEVMGCRYHFTLAGVKTFVMNQNEQNIGRGEATLFLENGDRFLVRFEGNKFVGVGVYYSADDQVKEGAIFDPNEFTGLALLTSENGSSFIGNIVGVVCQGPGVVILGSGDSYVGVMEKDTLSGVGIFHTSGTMCIGEFEDGEPDGHGAQILADGSLCVTNFKNGEISGGVICKFNPAEGVSYRRDYKDGKFDGYGAGISSDGTRYVGELKDETLSGQGAYMDAEGGAYVGEFRDGKPDGFGVFRGSDGVAFAGRWKEGNLFSADERVKTVQSQEVDLDELRRLYPACTDKGAWHKCFGELRIDGPVTQHLQVGVFKGNTLWTGHVYEFGRLAQILRDGVADSFTTCKFSESEGKYICPNGDSFFGFTYDNLGRRQGYGVYIWAHGAIYTGGALDDCWSGFGTMETEKIVERGEYKNGLLNGEGFSQFKEDGSTYLGRYVDGVPEGEGVATWSDGSRYAGQFRDGRKHGNGTCTWRSGVKYVGEWADDEINGQGVMTHADGTVESGRWENGKLIGR